MGVSFFINIFIKMGNKTSKTASLSDNTEREFGELREKELLELIEATQKYRQEVVKEKLILSKQSLLIQAPPKDIDPFLSAEINDLFKEYVQSTAELEEYRDDLSRFMGLPSDVNSAKNSCSSSTIIIVKSSRTIRAFIIFLINICFQYLNIVNINF